MATKTKMEKRGKLLGTGHRRVRVFQTERATLGVCFFACFTCSQTHQIQLGVTKTVQPLQTPTTNGQIHSEKHHENHKHKKHQRKQKNKEAKNKSNRRNQKNKKKKKNIHDSCEIDGPCREFWKTVFLFFWFSCNFPGRVAGFPRPASCAQGVCVWSSLCANQEDSQLHVSVLLGTLLRVAMSAVPFYWYKSLALAVPSTYRSMERHKTVNVHTYLYIHIYTHTIHIYTWHMLSHVEDY